MNERDIPAFILTKYRENAPLALIEQAKAFRKMPERDRAELLFYMAHHANMALQQQGGAPALAYEDVDRAIRGDA